MKAKYYLAMAQTVSDYWQSDELFLLKLKDGRIVGYASEFDCCTYDIHQACSEAHQSAKWFSTSKVDSKSWVPATLDEIKALNLEIYLIGSVQDMDIDGPMDSI